MTISNALRTRAAGFRQPCSGKSQRLGQLLTAKGVESQRWFAALSAHHVPPWGWLSLSLSPAGAEGRLPPPGASGDGWGPQSSPESTTLGPRAQPCWPNPLSPVLPSPAGAREARVRTPTPCCWHMGHSFPHVGTRASRGWAGRSPQLGWGAAGGPESRADRFRSSPALLSVIYPRY